MNKITLYHGTDARIIEMTNEERKQYFDDCNLVIDNLHPLFKPLLVWEKVEQVVNGEKRYIYEYPLKLKYEKKLNEKYGSYMYINLLEKIGMLNARNNNSGFYQYNNLYLCALKRTAMRYAQRSYAGGETGLNAYRLIQGFDVIFSGKQEIEGNVKSAMDRIKEFAKEGNERPAIVTIEDIDISNLTYEDGKPIDVKDLGKSEKWRAHDIKFRCLKPINLKECKMELLNEDLFKKIIKEDEQLYNI